MSATNQMTIMQVSSMDNPALPAMNLIEYASYQRMLRGKIEIIIKNSLTIGRSDNDLPQYTGDEIKTFIENNNENIDKAIDTIIREYHNDGDLELLDENDSSLYSRISEYLDDYVIIDYGDNEEEDNEEEDDEEEDDE